MMEKTEQFIHRTESPQGETPPAPASRVRVRTFLVPLILMVLHHLVLNVVAIGWLVYYLLVNLVSSSEFLMDPFNSTLPMELLTESGALTYASLIGMLILIPLYLLYLHLRKRKKDLLLKKEAATLPQWLYSLVVILGAMGLTQLWMTLLSSFDPLSLPGRLLQDYLDKVALVGPDGVSPVLDILATVILVPIGEELLFRGIIQGEFGKAFRPSVTILLTTVLFAVFHLDLIQGSYVLIAGFALSMVYHLTRQIALPIVLHIIYNFIGSGWLSRLAGFGEEADAILVFVLYGCILLGVAAALLLRRLGRQPARQRV